MAKLNNSLAYGFCKNVAANVIIKTLSTSKQKYEHVQSVNSDFKPVEIKCGRKKISVLAGNINNGTIALSMYHMMYSKNISFIYNSSVYVVNGDILRANWNNIMARNPKLYTDGVGMKTSMTYADVDKIASIAESITKISEDLQTYYIEKQKEYFK